MSYGRLAAAVAPLRPVVRQRSTAADLIALNTAWREAGTGPMGALGVPAVFASVRLLASTIDQLPLSADGGTPRWLDQPERFGGFDQGDLLQIAVTSMALRGRAYLMAERVGESWRLDPLHPAAVDAVTGQDDYGRLQVGFRVLGTRFPGVPREPGTWDRLGPRFVVHIPYLVTVDHPQGIGPLQAAREVLDGYYAVERQAAQLLDGGTYSGGRLETDQDITAATALRYQETWVSNRAAGKLPVLGAGLRYVNDIISPKDASWLESRSFNAAQVAQMFGIPPDVLGMSLMGGQSSLSYSNSRDNLRRYRMAAVAPFTSQIEDALTPLLGYPGRGAEEERRVRFDFTGWEETADAAPGT